MGEYVCNHAWCFLPLCGYTEVACWVVWHFDAIRPFAFRGGAPKDVGHNLVIGSCGTFLVLDVLFLGCLVGEVASDGFVVFDFHMGNQEVDRGILGDLDHVGLGLVFPFF